MYVGLLSICPCPLVILIDASTESPIHVLMLSVQAVRGLPRLRAPGIVPVILSRQNIGCTDAHYYLDLTRYIP